MFTTLLFFFPQLGTATVAASPDALWQSDARATRWQSDARATLWQGAD